VLKRANLVSVRAALVLLHDDNQDGPERAVALQRDDGRDGVALAEADRGACRDPAKPLHRVDKKFWTYNNARSTPDGGIITLRYG